MRPLTAGHARHVSALLLFATSVLASLGSVQRLSAQDGVLVSGLILDSRSGEPVPDVAVQLSPGDREALSDGTGRFIFDDVQPGTYQFRFGHLAYGDHVRELVVESEDVAFEIRISQEAIELEPLVVEAQTSEQMERRARGASQWVVEHDEIQRAVGTSRHLGDLVRQTVPGLRLRQSNDLPGVNVCLEFRAAAQISFVETPCRSPLVYLDGIPVSDPNFLYGMLSLGTIEQIEVLPPGQAGARYGTGALWGVILIDTQRPGIRTEDERGRPLVPLRAGRSTFDWTQDPGGHSTTRAFLTTFAGNALGLAAGVAIGRQCISIDAKDEIVSACSGYGTAAAGVSALLVPAIASSLAARWGGSTDQSVGQFVPAALGAALGLIPGYAFALSTVGAEAEAVNVIGHTMLLVGVPAIVTVADRLFRSSR